MATNDKQTDIQGDMAKLAEMVAWFQSDDFSLDGAIDKYNQAEALATKIDQDLSGLKNEITIIRDKFSS